MSYIIYPDGMFIWNTLINMAVLYIASLILGIKNSFFKRLVFSSVTAIVTTTLFILTIHLNKYIHHISYALIYMIMINIFFNIHTIKDIFEKTLIVVFSMVVISGLLNIFFRARVKSLIFGVIIILLTVPIIALISKYIKSTNQTKVNRYYIALNINNRLYNLKGFMDTGNSLKDPYTGNPVIILDYRVLKNIVGENAYNYIAKYHSTGIFDYLNIKNECCLKFYPLPYKTISTKMALMPAFRINYISFKDINYKTEKVVCGISRYKLENHNGFQVLLNENLKPIREEKFK